MSYRKITEHRVRELRPKPSRYQLNESNLQLEINPSGRKVWYFVGRQHGKVRKKKIGEYPETSVRRARELVTELKHERNRGSRVVEDPSTFSAFVEGPFREWCLSHRKRGRDTIMRLRCTHLPSLGNQRLRDISIQDIENQKARISRSKKPATVKRDLGDLRRVFSKAVEWGYIRRSPATSVSDPRVEHREKLYLSAQEMSRLHDALGSWDRISQQGTASGRGMHPMFATFVRVLVNTGMRRSEALGIEFCDIHMGDGTPNDPHTITVRPDVSKTGRRRVIPINESLVRGIWFIEKLIENGWSTHDWDEFARTYNRRLFTFRHVKRPWNRLRAMANLPHITLHHLRHNFASQLVLRGVAPSVIQRLMGHTSLETTMLYFSVRQEDAFEAVNLL